MAFTRKHYKAIAEIIKYQRRYIEPTKWESKDYSKAIADVTLNIAKDMSRMFASDNLRFDRDKFMNACGLE